MSHINYDNILNVPNYVIGVSSDIECRITTMCDYNSR